MSTPIALMTTTSLSSYLSLSSPYSGGSASASASPSVLATSGRSYTSNSDASCVLIEHGSYYNRHVRYNASDLMCTTWDINSSSIIAHQRFASNENINNMTRNLIVVFFSISLAKTLPRCYPSINVGSGVGKCWLWCQRRRSVLPALKSAATSSKSRAQKHDRWRQIPLNKYQRAGVQSRELVGARPHRVVGSMV